MTRQGTPLRTPAGGVPWRNAPRSSSQQRCGPGGPVFGLFGGGLGQITASRVHGIIIAGQTPATCMPRPATAALLLFPALQWCASPTKVAHRGRDSIRRPGQHAATQPAVPGGAQDSRGTGGARECRLRCACVSAAPGFACSWQENSSRAPHAPSCARRSPDSSLEYGSKTETGGCCCMLRLQPSNKPAHHPITGTSPGLAGMPLSAQA